MEDSDVKLSTLVGEVEVVCDTTKVVRFDDLEGTVCPVFSDVPGTTVLWGHARYPKTSDIFAIFFVEFVKRMLGITVRMTYPHNQLGSYNVRRLTAVVDWTKWHSIVDLPMKINYLFQGFAVGQMVWSPLDANSFQFCFTDFCRARLKAMQFSISRGLPINFTYLSDNERKFTGFANFSSTEMVLCHSPMSNSMIMDFYNFMFGTEEKAAKSKKSYYKRVLALQMNKPLFVYLKLFVLMSIISSAEAYKVPSMSILNIAKTAICFTVDNTIVWCYNNYARIMSGLPERIEEIVEPVVEPMRKYMVPIWAAIIIFYIFVFIIYRCFRTYSLAGIFLYAGVLSLWKNTATMLTWGSEVDIMFVVISAYCYIFYLLFDYIRRKISDYLGLRRAMVINNYTINNNTNIKPTFTLGEDGRMYCEFFAEGRLVRSELPTAFKYYKVEDKCISDKESLTDTKLYRKVELSVHPSVRRLTAHGVANAIKIKQVQTFSLFVAPAHAGVENAVIEGGVVVCHLVIPLWDLTFFVTLGHCGVPIARAEPILNYGCIERYFYSHRYGGSVAESHVEMDGGSKYLYYENPTDMGDCGLPLLTSTGKVVALHMRGNPNRGISMETVMKVTDLIFEDDKESDFYSSTPAYWVELIRQTLYDSFKGEDFKPIVNKFIPKILWSKGASHPTMVIPAYEDGKFNAHAFKAFGLDVKTEADVFDHLGGFLDGWAGQTSFQEFEDRQLAEMKSAIDMYNAAKNRYDFAAANAVMNSAVDKKMKAKDIGNFIVTHPEIKTTNEIDLAKRKKLLVRKVNLDPSTITKKNRKKGDRFQEDEEEYFDVQYEDDFDVFDYEDDYEPEHDFISEKGDDRAWSVSGKEEWEEMDFGFDDEESASLSDLLIIKSAEESEYDLTPLADGEVQPKRKAKDRVKLPDADYGNPDLSHEGTTRSFFNYQKLAADRRRKYKDVDENSLLDEELEKELVYTYRNRKKFPDTKENFREWILSGAFTDMGKGSVGWGKEMKGIINKAALVGRKVKTVKGKSKVYIDEIAFDAFWQKFEPLLNGDFGREMEFFVFPKDEGTPIEKINANMNRLIFNVDPYYNILGAFLMRDLNFPVGKVSPAGHDFYKLEFSDKMQKAFPPNDPDYVCGDVKKSDCGFLKNAVVLGTSILTRFYGKDALIVKLWQKLMGPGTIYHLPDGKRFRKNYWGYLPSGMWNTLLMNSWVYWVAVRKGGARKAVVQGDDFQAIGRPGDMSRFGIEVSYEDAEWCKMVYKPIGDRCIVTINKGTRQVIQTLPVKDRKMFHHTGHVQVAMRMIHAPETAADTVRNAALYFCLDPEPFISTYRKFKEFVEKEKFDASKFDNWRKSFLVSCDKALLMRLSKSRDTSHYCSPVEWSE